MDKIKAVVQGVLPEGRNGPFAVAISDQIEGSVIFSLGSDVWEEEDWPEKGDEVFFDQLEEELTGWRANRARLWGPFDEE